MKSQKSTRHDALILGGGLAGLTLALQLKQSNPDLSILVLEKRTEAAPVASHKVGESTVELGSHYLREVLGLKQYLEEKQLPKFGFRFFLSPEHSGDIARRVEVGSKLSNPIPAHQIDRGLLENELVRQLEAAGVAVLLGASVQEVELSKTGHTVRYEIAGETCTATGNWLIDSTGRRSFLKRKLGLEKATDHAINAAWFRLGSPIDIDDWSDNLQWKHCLAPGRRHLATNHLMGRGYWVWIIPLVTGNTSIGIVADPALHPFDTFNTAEKAMQWLEKYEPLAAKMLGKHWSGLIDFKVMKHFAHDINQFYSTDRWGITGDAGAFLDPFYSPGTDFIALSNSWLTELIVRDSRGENIALRTMIYQHTYRELLNGWILLYKNMYSLFGQTQIMLFKIIWDWSTYWAIPSLIFANKGYTDIDFLKQYATTANSIGHRFATLNAQMQALFLAWSRHGTAPCSDQHINVFALAYLHQFHLELAEKFTPEQLIRKVASNLEILEQVAAELFRRVSTTLHGTPPDMSVDPYTMVITDTRDVLLEKAQRPGALGVVESIRTDIETVWLSPVHHKHEAYVE